MIRRFRGQSRGNSRGKVRQGFFRPLGVTVLLILAALFLGGGVARAGNGVPEPVPPVDLTTLGIEELMGIEVDTVSGASRYEQPVTEAPASVYIVTADEVRRYGYRTLADILQSIPGFWTTNDRNYLYAGIRGFGLPGDYGTRVLLLVDGVRQNEPVYQASYIGNEFAIDVDLIDRVEVIRGPGHTLYGANAVLAVINVVTKRGRDIGGLEVSGEAGSFGTYKGRVTYGGDVAPEGSVLLSGTFLHSRGQDHFYPEFASPDTGFGWARRSDGERSGSAFLKLVYRDLTLEGGYVKRDKTIPTAPWDTIFNNPGTRTADTGMFLDLKYRRTFTGGLDVMSRISWNHYGYDGRYLYAADEEDGIPLVYANIDKTRSTWLQGEVQLVGSVSERHRLLGGIEFRDVLRMDQLNYDLATNLADRRSAWNAGVYIQDEFRILDTLILNAGIRYDHFDTFGGTVNPRLALIYSPLYGTTVKLLYGTAFRPPSGYELYYGDGSTQKANPGLHEERSSSWELILEQYLGRRIRGSISAFHTRVRGLITLVRDPYDDLLVFRNIDRAEMKGVELELNGKWENGIRGRVSYTFQEGRDVAWDAWLPNSPRHLAKLNLTIPVVREKVSLGLEEQYASGRKTLGGRKTRDMISTNVTLFARKLLKDLELSASVYNLFNTRYDVPAGEEHLQDSLRQDGRSFRVKVTGRF